MKDGLPVNSINAHLQDRTGYIWAATFDGLVRFDGLRFTVFNSANSEELPSNRIIRLKEGRDGSLWLTTEQGHIVRFRDGRFTNIAFESGKPQGMPILFVDSAGVVWVGTHEGLWTVRRDRLGPGRARNARRARHRHPPAARWKPLGRHEWRGSLPGHG